MYVCVFCDCTFDTFIYAHKRCTKAMCIFSKLLDENLARQMAIFPLSNTFSLLCFKKSIKTSLQAKINSFNDAAQSLSCHAQKIHFPE